MVNVIEKYSLHLLEMGIHQNISKWEKPSSFYEER